MSNQQYRVVNPYNFIPLGKSPVRSDIADTYADPKSLLSGWLEVRITPKTDLIVTDGVAHHKEDTPDHSEYGFYRINGMPAIPGSSLRGMLRSVYETASNSCLLFSEADEYITVRRTQYQSMKKRALLGKNKNGVWMLFPVIDPPQRKEVWNYKRDIKNDGTCHNVHAGEKTESGWAQFQVPVSVGGKDKHGVYHVTYLQEDPKAAPIELTETDYQKLLKTAKESEDNDASGGNSTPASKAIHKRWVKCLEEAAKNDSLRVPVWYEEKNGGYYLSISQIGRVAFQKAWAGLMTAYAPCSDKTKMCPACQLFGTVQVPGRNSVGFKGRLRFSDATPSDGAVPSEWKTESITLEILGTPKPSAFEFYTTGSMKDVFDKNVDDGNMSVRGRKMYWHHPADKFGANKNRMNATMEALAPGEGVAFTSRIYFDRITQKQLDELRWVVTLGDGPEGNHCHKLGHARPLGYGSVKLDLLKTVTRTVTAEGYALNETLPQGPVPCPWDTDKDPIRSLLTMTAFTAVKKNDGPVAYPMENGKNGKAAVFNWFSDNRSKWFSSNRSERPQTLPLPTAQPKGLKTELSPAEYEDARRKAAQEAETNEDKQPPRQDKPQQHENRQQTAVPNRDEKQPAPAPQDVPKPNAERNNLQKQTVKATVRQFKTYMGEYGKAAICFTEAGDKLFLVSRDRSLIDDVGLKTGDTVDAYVQFYDENNQNWRAVLSRH